MTSALESNRDFAVPPVLRSGSEGGIHFAPEVHFGKINCEFRIMNSSDCIVASLETKSKSPLHRTGGFATIKDPWIGRMWQSLQFLTPARIQPEGLRVTHSAEPSSLASAFVVAIRSQPSSWCDPAEITHNSGNLRIQSKFNALRFSIIHPNNSK